MRTIFQRPAWSHFKTKKTRFLARSFVLTVIIEVKIPSRHAQISIHITKHTQHLTNQCSNRNIHCLSCSLVKSTYNFKYLLNFPISVRIHSNYYEVFLYFHCYCILSYYIVYYRILFYFCKATAQQLFSVATYIPLHSLCLLLLYLKSVPDTVPSSWPCLTALCNLFLMIQTSIFLKIYLITISSECIFVFLLSTFLFAILIIIRIVIIIILSNI